ncbi:MAG: DUF1566 domain-containing protein [Actinobacteria bacterium]|uniref:Unannotated protein n=1 Tax=freshwater metagenome TaxID=449393 RepID=A0A6J7LRP0_9ZZZZ|nr:DUF1566 domain-containing protein [Actinomycetota bacterium]
MTPLLRITTATLTLGLLLAASLAGCGGSATTSKMAAVEKCHVNAEFCRPGDSGPGGGTVFSVIPGKGRATVLEVYDGYWYEDCDRCAPSPAGSGPDAHGSGPVTWNQAVQLIAAFNEDNKDLGGETDWRLPTDLELSVLNKYPGRGKIGGSFQNDWYWSSTTAHGLVDVRNFGTGEPNTRPLTDLAVMRPIRTAQLPLS